MARVGFTLVELLVVIGIIAVLAAVLVAAMSSALASGKATVSMSNLHQLAAANLAYAADNDGTYCPAANDSTLSILWCGARTDPGSGYDLTQGYLSPYLGQNSQVKVCPLLAGMYVDPTHDESASGYGYNDVYIGGSAGTYQPVKVVNVPHPSTTVMFATTGWIWATGIQKYSFSKPSDWLPGTLHFRAHGRALIAWCDGHVTAELPSQVYDTDRYTHTILGFFGPTSKGGYWNPDYAGP